MLYDTAEKSGVELDLLLEPCQKNTCAAIVASSIFLKKKYGKINNKDSVVACFCPADHFLSDAQNLLRTILKAAHFTDDESIFVVGVPPKFPSTSYGYLSSEGNLESDKFLQVRQFIEKPDYKKLLNCSRNKVYTGTQGILSRSLQHY